MLGEAVYVYGVSPQGGDLPPVHGIEDAELRAVDHDGLVALTSRLSREALSARDLRAHWRVLQEAFEQTTVLPVRFGTVMESEDAVREQLLGPNAERLSVLLDQMNGLVQLSVKGRYDEDALLRMIVRGDPAIATLRERLGCRPTEATRAEQLRLGQMVESQVAWQRHRDTELAIEMLEPAALASRAEEVGHPAAFDLAFLVRRSSESTFSEAVRGLREQVGGRIEIRYVGPLPPFSFAEADLIGGGDGWD